MSENLNNATILLGVTGGIAAYKAAALASLLVQSGARVEVMMTEAAQRLVQPLTFAAITHAPVHTDPFTPWHGDFSGHVSLAQDAELLIVAPATAASIARIALGLSDDLIGLAALSTPAPLLLAPAMEDRMYHHPATQMHLAKLRERGATIVGPEHGRLASGATGDGRMASPESIVAAVRAILRRPGLLTGSTVVVTAGGTREPIDPVRFIGNRSSGKMGYAIAEAAVATGAAVTLITGPSDLAPPPGAKVVRVETTREMQDAVELAVDGADLLVMAAAVADFRPAAAAQHKIKKHAGADRLAIELVRNPDILASVNRPGLLKIGFAAETDDLVANAARKLEEKGLAMIVANDAAATIGAEDSEATIISADGSVRALPRMPKHDLATKIVTLAADLLDKKKLTVA